MIYEFIEALLSDAPKWARKQNLVKESVAIGARYKRQSKAWAEHLANCQNEIQEFVLKYKSAKRITILGSGHLLDVPAGLLENKSYEFYLFDAVHPRSIRKTRYKAKCHFLVADLNLGAQELKRQFHSEFSACDLVISLNLLSQLALSGSQHLQQKPNERASYAKSLVENHISLLESMARPYLLISDFEKHFIGLKGENILSESSLWDHQLPKPKRIWPWNLAPNGEISKDYRLELQVGVWEKIGL